MKKKMGLEIFVLIMFIFLTIINIYLGKYFIASCWGVAMLLKGYYVRKELG